VCSDVIVPQITTAVRWFSCHGILAFQLTGLPILFTMQSVRFCDPSCTDMMHLLHSRLGNNREYDLYVCEVIKNKSSLIDSQLYIWITTCILTCSVSAVAYCQNTMVKKRVNCHKENCHGVQSPEEWKVVRDDCVLSN
jgi:hypothetical protein